MSADLLEAALAYARRGRPVFPCWGVLEGRCTCPDGAVCERPGKHPRTQHGFKDASTDEAKIRAWWALCPHANIGIPTGAASGLIVIDIDPLNGGDVTFDEVCGTLGKPPDTLTSTTQSKGKHLWFRDPGGIKSGSNVLARGIDVRADGGYVVVPPSKGVLGEYSWDTLSGEPDDMVAVVPPAWLAALRPKTEPSQSAAPPVDRTIAKGGRATALMSLAGSMRRRGMDAVEIEAALLVFNARRCVPPLPDKQVAGIAQGAGRYGAADDVVDAGGVVSASTPTRVRNWRTFPLATLPAPLRRLAKEGGASIGCDPSAIAVLLLGALATAIGTTRRIVLKRGWAEYAIVWVLLVGLSGKFRKSPVVDLVAKPLRERQEKLLAAWMKEMEVFEKQQLEYELAVTQWKQRNRKAVQPDAAPDRPKKPFLPRTVVSDVTVEALAPILAEIPRGVGLVRDELSGWVKGFNQYKTGGQGADVPHWLEAHRGGPWFKDRRKDREFLYVPCAAVSVIGSIQPGMLGACFRPDLFDCGLVARIIFVFPPTKPRRWSDVEVSAKTEQDYADIIDNLLELRFAERTPDQADDASRPVDLGLTPDARERFKRFVNEHGARTDDADDDIAAAFSKLEGYAARIALILHLVDAVRGVKDCHVNGPIGLRHIEAGIEIATWVADETERLYATFQESEEDGARRVLADRVQSWGGEATVRDVQLHMRAYPTADVARAALQDLVDNDLAVWTTRPSGPDGGRPTDVARLVGSNPTQAVDADTTHESPEETEVVSASTPEEELEALDQFSDAKVCVPVSAADIAPPVAVPRDLAAIERAEAALEEARWRSATEADVRVFLNALARLTSPEEAQTTLNDIDRDIAEAAGDGT